jgi:hypothetical protein
VWMRGERTHVFPRVDAPHPRPGAIFRRSVGFMYICVCVCCVCVCVHTGTRAHSRTRASFLFRVTPSVARLSGLIEFRECGCREALVFYF